jgi:hypothetical protein
MSSLKQLQESFQHGILAGDDAILAEIKCARDFGRHVPEFFKRAPASPSIPSLLRSRR